MLVKLFVLASCLHNLALLWMSLFALWSTKCVCVPVNALACRIVFALCDCKCSLRDVVILGRVE